MQTAISVTDRLVQVPTYHSQVPNSHQRLNTPGFHGIGLPPTSYAPGFHRAPGYSKDNLSHLTFNISEWSSAKNGAQARHYHNVAKRRAGLASIEEKARLTNLTSTMVFPTLASITTTEAPESTIENSSCSSNQQASASTPAVAAETLPPLEDPELVGTVAATAARERRLYMEKCSSEREALRQENKSWDFMLGQMSDWQERERSWEGFKKNVEGRKLLGNKLFRRFLP